MAIEYRLMVDWEGSGVYVDEWDRVIDIQRAVFGRDYGSQILGKVIAGVLELDLTNDDGRFDRDNPLSPLHEQVRVQRRIGLQAVVTDSGVATTWYLWWGYTHRIVPHTTQSGNDYVHLEAYGIFSLLTNRPVSTPLRIAIAAEDAIHVVLDRAQLSAEQRGTIEGSTILDRWWTNAQEAIAAIRDIEETEGGTVREQTVTDDGPKVVMEHREYRVIGDRRNSRLTLSDDPTDAGAYHIIQEDLVESVQDVYNVAQVPLRQFDATAVETVLWSLPSTLELEAGESISFVVSYPSVSSPVGHVGVASWTTLEADVDYLGNSQADGLGNDLTANLAVTVDEAATQLRIMVENTSNTLDMVIIRLRARGVPLVETQPTIIEVRDEESIVDADYGPRELPLPAQFLSSVDEVVSYGRFTLRSLAQPRLRGRVTFDTEEFLLEGNRPVDMTDRITLSYKGVSYQMFVEGGNHQIEPGGRHLQDLVLSPADVSGNIIILDVGPGLGSGILAR